MNHPARFARALAALVLGVCCTHAQTPSFPQLINPDFESGEAGSEPEGWRVPPVLRDAGYSAVLTDVDPAHGRLCVVISKDSTPAKPQTFGNILQSIDATPFRGKRVRFRAAVRAEVAGRGSQGALWLRVDRKEIVGGQPLMGFFDNMAERPISSNTWAHYEIIGDVETDAAKIFLGCMLQGSGRVWFDDATLEVLGDAPAIVAETPCPLSTQGLANVVAFTRLLGYVRYFHPSDEAASTVWETFASAGLRAVESARDADELAQRLTSLFAPIAPTVRITRAPQPAAANLPQPDGERIMTWKHVGLGTGGRASLYSSQRVSEARSTAATTEELARLLPIEADLGGGVICTVPVAVSVDERGTLPRATPVASTALPMPTRSTGTSTDRSTRLAIIALAWNILEHSYPYFDFVGTDWSAELTTALQRAATDPDPIAFLGTLRRLIAALHDGHGNVNFQGDRRIATPSFRAEWIENRLTLSAVDDSARALGLAPGDVIVSIDGQPVADVRAAAEAEISGATPQWIRYRSARDLFRGERGSTLELEIEPFAAPGEHKHVTVTRDAMNAQGKRRGEVIAEVEPGIFYLDLDRLTTAEFTAALPKLEQARGLIFDMRGYPAQLNSHEFFSHLTSTALTSAQWHTPHITRPDHVGMNFVRSGEWTIRPKEPFLAAKRVFLTDGRAISYAESCMGIVEHYKLGSIVGEPTAGTNGNINTLMLPGGYSIVWTGMKVLKHDGSRHHGVGIQPTVPASPTRNGIAAGRDELLERALQVMKSE